jgi:hypothetical protein
MTLKPEVVTEFTLLDAAVVVEARPEGGPERR